MVLEDSISYEEVIGMLYGKDHVKAKEDAELSSRIYEESKQYIGSPVDTWPKIQMNWDVSRESQRFSMDGVLPKDFNRSYPDGLLLGYVLLDELDKILHRFSRRDEGELWAVGSVTKLAKLIVYLSEGRSISPPLIKPVKDEQISFEGGHHRYAIAKVIGAKRIPVHIKKEHKSEIDRLLNVDWIGQGHLIEKTKLYEKTINQPHHMSHILE